MELYKHFKGNTYIKLHEAIHSETGENLVIYACTKTGKIYARPVVMFYDYIDREEYKGRRFVKETSNE